MVPGMEDDRDATIRSRELGAHLRKALEHKGLSGNAVAKTLGISQATMSRMLTGRRGSSEANVGGVLALCGVTGEEREFLLELCRNPGGPGWLQKYGSRLPNQVQTFVRHEDMAISYFHYQPMVMPGLLQTANYARALITGHPTLPNAEVEDRVSARIERHRIFDRPAPADFTFLIHERVLRTPTGGAEVMSEQLHHLLRMSVRENILMQVIPISAGVHVAPAGPFIFMEFANIRPVVYIEGEVSGLFLEDDADSG